MVLSFWRKLFPVVSKRVRKMAANLFHPQDFFVSKPNLTFFATSDFGNVNNYVKQVALSMNNYKDAPDMIAGIGDLFYEDGVESIDDRLFDLIWREQFIKPYDRLQVPWRMALGNHEYFGNPRAPVDYTNSSHNADKLWYLPDNNYSFRYFLADNTEIQFFVLDTNGCQGHVFRSHPETISQLVNSIEQLKVALAASTARWKIVSGHHLLYTPGIGHSSSADCLRSDWYSIAGKKRRQGFGLEKVLIEGDVNIYMAGHEHSFIHHVEHGVHHFCCGASGADIRSGAGLYQGVNRNTSVLWRAESGRTIGFVAVEADVDKLVVSFIAAPGGEVIREVVIPHPIPNTVSFTSHSIQELDASNLVTEIRTDGAAIGSKFIEVDEDSMNGSKGKTAAGSTIGNELR